MRIRIWRRSQKLKAYQLGGDLVDKKRVQRILFVNLTNIGDCILTLPVLSVLRGEFPGARVDMICGRAPLALFQGCSDLNQIFVYEKNWGLMDKWKWVREIVRTRYDLIVDLKHTAIPLLVRSKYRTSLFRRKFKESQSVREKHLSVLKPLGLDLSNRKVIELYGEQESEKVFCELKKLGLKDGESYAVVVPGANSSTKRWTEEGFLGVVSYLQSKGLAVVILGGDAEMELTRSLKDKSDSPEGVYDLGGGTSLKEAAACIAVSEIVISNDSALMQIAVELGKKTVAIFGPTNPWKYAHEDERSLVVRHDLKCSPCEMAQCHIDRRKCLDDLKAEEVNEKIETLLV